VVFAYIYVLITILQLRTSLCIAVVADDAFSTNANMVFSADDCILIENLYKFKKYAAKRLIREFPTKGWSVSSVKKLLQKLRDTGTTAWRASFVGVPHCSPGSQVKMPEETSSTGTNRGKLRITPDSSEETFASFPCFCCGFHILYRREDI